MDKPKPNKPRPTTMADTVARKMAEKKLRSNPANYTYKGKYGFDGSQGIPPKSPRG